MNLNLRILEGRNTSRNISAPVENRGFGGTMLRAPQLGCNRHRQGGKSTAQLFTDKQFDKQKEGR